MASAADTHIQSAPARERSTSRTRKQPLARPTTPLRPPSRTSLRAPSGATTTPTSSLHRSAGGGGAGVGNGASSTSSNAAGGPGGHAEEPASTALDALEPQFAELSDSLADLEANMMHLQLLHESVSRFDENFSSFLYGLTMGAFCVDFPEAPPSNADVFRRYAAAATGDGAGKGRAGGGTPLRGGADRHGRPGDVEATFLTTDTSFVNDPPASVKTVRHAAPPGPRGGGTAASSRSGAASSRGRGGIPTRGGAPTSSRGGTAGRGSGIGRGRVRGVRS